jgi:hypothetical protein
LDSRANRLESVTHACVRRCLSACVLASSRNQFLCQSRTTPPAFQARPSFHISPSAGTAPCHVYACTPGAMILQHAFRQHLLRVCTRGMAVARVACGMAFVACFQKRPAHRREATRAIPLLPSDGAPFRASPPPLHALALAPSRFVPGCAASMPVAHPLRIRLPP